MPKKRRTRIDFKPFLFLRHITLLSAKYGKIRDLKDLRNFDNNLRTNIKLYRKIYNYIIKYYKNNYKNKNLKHQD